MTIADNNNSTKTSENIEVLYTSTNAKHKKGIYLVLYIETQLNLKLSSNQNKTQFKRVNNILYQYKKVIKVYTF